MQLHKLKISYPKKAKRRVGRGGKRGTFSGRGQKGQHSRGGRKIVPAEKELIRKFPKLRGIKNKPKSVISFEINVGDIDKRFGSHKIINKQLLIKMGLLQKMGQKAKILGNGEVKKAFTIEEIAVSKQAEEKIVAAGGSVKK